MTRIARGEWWTALVRYGTGPAAWVSSWRGVYRAARVLLVHSECAKQALGSKGQPAPRQGGDQHTAVKMIRVLARLALRAVSMRWWGRASCAWAAGSCRRA